MRSALVVLCVLSFLASAGTVQAYYDDSVVIEIGNAPPHYATTTPSTSSPSSNVAPGNASSSTSSPTGNTDQGTPGGTNGNTDTTASGGPSGAGPDTGSAGANTGGTVATPPSSPQEQEKVASGLFDFLNSAGAITEQGSMGSTGQSNVGGGGAGAGNTASSSGNAFGGNGAGASGNSFADTGTITINAAKVRTALLGKLEFKDILDSFAASILGGSPRQGISKHDLTLIAAATILQDSNIDEVSFGATRFEIVYKSRGYILAFIPVSFPVRVAVDPQAKALQGEVSIGLPWYRFFLWTLFDTGLLSREIDAVVKTQGVPQQGDSPNDVQRRLFDAVSGLLKDQLGTIGGSIEGN